MTYRGEGAGRKEEAGRVIRREVPIELAPVAPAPDPPRRRRPWREFLSAWVVVVVIGLLIGQYSLQHSSSGEHPRPLPGPVSGHWPHWMDQACGNYAPALGADVLNDYGPQPLVLVYCQLGVTEQVAQP